MPNIPYRIMSEHIYKQIIGDVLVIQCWLAEVYDRSPSTLALHTDIHGHLFRQLNVNQQDKTAVSTRTT